MTSLILLLSLFFSSAQALAANGGDGFMLEYTVIDQSFDETMERVELAHELGATHFIVPVLICQDSRTADRVHWCERSTQFTTVAEGRKEGERLDSLRMILSELKTRGFTTAVMPFLISYDDSWRGQFEPEHFDRWSASYSEMLDRIISAVADQGLSEFIVGSELSRLYVPTWPLARKAHARYWADTLRRVRQQLNRRSETPIAVFAVANWDQYDSIPFWADSDYIGLSSYYPLANEGEEPTPQRLIAGWTSWARKLEVLSQKTGRKLYFAELGYQSRSDAFYHPWHYEDPSVLDHEMQIKLYRAFASIWASTDPTVARFGQALHRFTIWALSRSRTPLEDKGYTIIEKPVAKTVAELFQARASLRGETPKSSIPVVFTLDDIPMWFVGDVDERVENYRGTRSLLSSRAIPAVTFVNPAFVTDRREWDELRAFPGAGLILGNHTSRHVVRGETSAAAFLADLDEGAAILSREVPGWDSRHRFFRFPNLDWGGRKAEQTCEAIRSRNYSILTVSLDSRDVGNIEAYHHAAGPTVAERPALGAEAQAIAKAMLEEIDRAFEVALRQRRSDRLQGSALVFLLHSSRFQRDYLPNILSRLAHKGVRWVSPTVDQLRAYDFNRRCLPACLSSGLCR